MKKAVGYSRVSTAEQSADGVSLEAQRAKIEAYCRLYDIELVAVIVDAGESGKSLNRPGLRQALAMMNSGQAEGMVIAKLDRLSRSVSDWNDLIDGTFGEKAGKQLWSVADSIDTTTAAGRLVLNVLMSVSQWEREAIGERTRDALAYKRQKGERISRRIPFGYDLTQDGKTLTRNEEEQKVIARIRELREEGESYRAIARNLTEWGIKTKEGHSEWSHKTVKSILARAAKLRKPA